SLHSSPAGHFYRCPAEYPCVYIHQIMIKTITHIRNQILHTVSALSRIIVAHYRLPRTNSLVACGFPKLTTIKNNRAHPL
ncbi:MAG: hypothetical protein PHO85_06745, partial [Candidatus Cloacimonetes bacterium]|nr:hypothetical protein [Candidatus Cloacimonadota bacterium]